MIQISQSPVVYLELYTGNLVRASGLARLGRAWWERWF